MSRSAASGDPLPTGSRLTTWIVTGTGLSLLVALPALFARPWADERIYLYWPEQIAGRNPLRLVSRVIHEIPGYLEAGVFRWLSRLFTFTENWVLVRASLTVGLPVNVLRAIPKAAMAALMCTVLIGTLDQYRRAGKARASSSTWMTLMGATVVVFGASLTIFNPPTHPLTLFPTLYLGTAGLALALPLLFGRIRLQELRELEEPNNDWRFGPVRLLGFAILGAALASMIELAYLAIPLVFVHVVLIDSTFVGIRREGWRRLVGSRSTRAWAAMTVGFLAVFVPTRSLIMNICAGGGCYRAAEPVLGSGFLERWPGRLVAGAFPVLQIDQIHVALRALQVRREVWILALAAAGAAAWALRRAWRHTGTPDPLSQRWLGAAAGYAAIVLLLAATLSSLGRAVQEQAVGLAPWRESGFTWVAWSILLAVGATAIVLRAGFGLRVVVGLVLVAGVFLASVQNQADLARVRSRNENRIHNQIALLLVDFDQTDFGNAQRCAVIDELLAMTGSESERQKMQFLSDLLDTVAVNHHGVQFCAG